MARISGGPDLSASHIPKGIAVFSSHLSSAAAGFFPVSLLATLLLVLFGAVGMTTPIWLDACLFVTGVLVAIAAYRSRKVPSRRKRMHPRRIVPELLSERMRRDIGLDNL